MEKEKKKEEGEKVSLLTHATARGMGKNSLNPDIVQIGWPPPPYEILAPKEHFFPEANTMNVFQCGHWRLKYRGMSV